MTRPSWAEVKRMLDMHLAREHPNDGATRESHSPPLLNHRHVWSSDPVWGEHAEHGGNLHHPISTDEDRVMWFEDGWIGYYD